MNEYSCPECGKGMVVAKGDMVALDNGVTIYCPHKECPSQEVSGHGDNEKEAWKTVQEKFVARADRK